LAVLGSDTPIGTGLEAHNTFILVINLNKIFSRSLNKNMPYIELFMDKNCENLGALGAPPPHPRVVIRTYC